MDQGPHGVPAPAPTAAAVPSNTVLYRLVQEHLETCLALARDGDAPGIPRSVERGLRHSLTCGLLAYGFPPRPLCGLRP